MAEGAYFGVERRVVAVRFSWGERVTTRAFVGENLKLWEKEKKEKLSKR